MAKPNNPKKPGGSKKPKPKYNPRTIKKLTPAQIKKLRKLVILNTVAKSRASAKNPKSRKQNPKSQSGQLELFPKKPSKKSTSEPTSKPKGKQLESRVRTPEKQAVERFNEFITKNSAWKSKFSNFKEFSETVRRAFDLKTIGEAHNLINNHFDKVELLLHTREHLITEINAKKGNLTEGDISRILDAIEKLNANIKVNKKEIINSITRRVKEYRRGFAKEIRDKLLEFDGKFKKIDNTLVEILKASRSRKPLSEGSKKFILEEFRKLNDALVAMESRSGLQRDRFEQILNAATESLAKMEKALQEHPEAFETIFKQVLSESLVNNNDALIFRMEQRWGLKYKDVLKRFVEIKTAIKDGLKLTQKEIRELDYNLELLDKSISKDFKTVNKALRAIGELLGKDRLNKIVKKAIAESKIPDNVLKKMQEYFQKTEYKKIIDDALKSRFDNIDKSINNLSTSLTDILAEVQKDRNLSPQDKLFLEQNFNELKSALAKDGELGKILTNIEKILGKTPEGFKKILNEVFANALATNNDALVKKIMDMIDKNWGGKYKYLRSRFVEVLKEIKTNRKYIEQGFELTGKNIDKLGTFLEDMNKFNAERFGDLEAAINKLEGFSPTEKKELMDKIEKIIAEVGESKTLSQDSLDLLKELKDKGLNVDNIQSILDPILETALETNNTKIIDQIKALDLLTTPELDARLAELLDKINENTDSRFEEIDKKLDELKEKKPDKDSKGDDKGSETKTETTGGGKPKKSWVDKVGGLRGIGGAGLIVLILLAIFWALTKTKDVATSRISQSYSITPVFGETLTTAGTTSSSLLGSLGGINPLIIIGIVAVLFLLFPKK